MDREALERSVRACYSTWSKRYRADYYDAKGAYPPIHVDIVRELLKATQAKRVIDAGCGPASMLRDLTLPGLSRFGFDLTPEMVAEARKVLSAQGVSEENIWQGSVLDAHAFRPPSQPGGASFDAAICFGVLPHVPAEADEVVLRHLHDAVRPGGLIALEARNALFALFSLNRYTRDFFRDVLIRESDLSPRAGYERDALQSALGELDARFRMDLPPKRQGYDGEQGYDEILSRTHVPMELQAKAERIGFRSVRPMFYHYHALPPLLEDQAPELFRSQSIAMEDPDDWRGYIMASAFILVGERAG